MQGHSLRPQRNDAQTALHQLGSSFPHHHSQMLSQAIGRSQPEAFVGLLLTRDIQKTLPSWNLALLLFLLQYSRGLNEMLVCSLSKCSFLKRQLWVRLSIQKVILTLPTITGEA